MDFKYPYTDFHELNLDWFLAEFKKLVEEWAKVQQDWADTQQAYQDLHDYVENYFANLDLYQEVHDILWSPKMQGNIQIILSNLTTNMLPGVVADQITAVVASQLSTVVALQLPAVVADKLPDVLPAAVAGEATVWLADHVDPDTGYVIDDTLSIALAAADAKATGDAIENQKDDIAYTNINLHDTDMSIISKSGGYYDVNGKFNAYAGWTCYKAIIPTVLNYMNRINGTGSVIHSGTSIPSMIYLDVYGNVLSTSFTDGVISSFDISTAPTGSFYVCLNTTSTLNVIAITKNVEDMKDYINSPLYTGRAYFDKISEFIFEYDFYNILPPNTVKTSGYELINGIPTANASFTVYDYIKCDMLKSVAVTKITTPGHRGLSDSVKIAFYDTDKNFICQINTAFSNIPYNAVYMRFSIPSTYTYGTYAVAVNNGEMPINDNYVSYGESFVYKYRDFIGKKICTFGDSIASSDNGVRDANTWVKRVAEYFNCESYNRGIGGSCVTASKADGTPRTGYAYVDSDGDAGDIRVVYSEPHTFADYPTEINPCMETAERCNTIPVDTDIVIIIAGANDTGSTTPALFETAYKQMLNNIQTRVPDAKIICCTMPYHKAYDYSDGDTEYNRLREKIRISAAYYGFPVIELRRTMGVNPHNCNDYMNDNVHYNTTAGRKKIAECMINTLKGYSKL